VLAPEHPSTVTAHTLAHVHRMPGTYTETP
jgi:hypothetical protein